MNIYVGGVNGVGKTSLINEVCEINQRFEHIKLSVQMMKTMRIESDYEALRSKSKIDQDEALSKIMNELIENPGQKFRLIDGHYLNIVRGETVDRTGTWMGKLDAIVLITSNVDRVLNRLKNSDRDRALFLPQSNERDARRVYSQYMTQTEHRFHELVKQYKLPMSIIENEDSEEAARKLIDYCESLSI